jgi:Putative translation initiation inhibitor, yjgF family
MIDIKKNILNNNIIIPEAIKPIANYDPFSRSDNLIFVSGQVPIVNEK